jgi:hypothetical protein
LPAISAVYSKNLSVFEKRALRLDPALPLSPGRAESHGFEYFRHGTLSLYAASETQTGIVLGKTATRHTSSEFVAFLREIVASQKADKAIPVIADNLSAHKTKLVLPNPTPCDPPRSVHFDRESAQQTYALHPLL